jgi:hypothetical protein
MALTTEQRATLKAFVEADPVLSLKPATAQGAYEIAQELQAIASPEFVVWKTATTKREILKNGFDWTRLDNLSQGKARIWSEIFIDGEVDASEPNVRTGIDAVWVGTAADLAVRAAVYVHCKRPANIAEKLFATGTGSDASPATMSLEGSINYNDVGLAMGWAF